MQITVDCPECQSRFQLHADLRGRRIRCPNSACRAPFVVEEAEAAPPPPKKKGGLPRPVTNPTASVPSPFARANDLTAPLPKKKVKPADTAPVEELDWNAAPPPVQSGKSPADKPASPLPLPPPPPPRRGWVIALGMIVATIGLIAGGTWYVQRLIGRNEEALRTEAEADYAASRFRASSIKYKTLSEKYGGTTHGPEYRLLADLSDVRDQASQEPTGTLKAIRDFADKYARDPAFKPHRDGLGATALAVATQLATAANAAAPTGEPAEVEALVTTGEDALALVSRYSSKPGETVGLRAQFDKALDAVIKAKERREQVAAVLALMRREKPDLTVADALALRYRVTDEPSVVSARRDAESRVYRLVPYEPLDRPPQTTAPGDGPPSLLLELTPANRSQPGEIVLAVARGLLTAHDSRDGRRLWASRVGLDATDLPVRVAGRGDEPELALVAAADPPGLTARDVKTGAVVWHQTLEAPALGRPVQYAGRLFVPTVDPRGIVYDFDVRRGTLRGRFEAGQPLAAGAAIDTLTGRLYVPARGQFVYVFGYAAAAQVAGPSAATVPRCEGLLPTNHPPGSLRGQPIVVTGEDGIEVPRLLILGVSDGIDAMKLRAFRLLDNPAQSPTQAEVRLPGWSWFPPYHDPEKLVLVTDTGAVGLFGFQQASASDPPIFSLLGGEPPSAGVRSAARGLLVHAEESGFWSLADGALQQWRLGLTRDQGRVLRSIWQDGPKLGSPLHTAQVSADRSTLFLVTQTTNPPAFRFTAIEARTGRIVWQRPLGLGPQGDPLVLNGAVVVLDASSALVRFDPAKHPPTDATWQSGGQRIAPPLLDVIGTPTVVRSADRLTAAALATVPAPANKLRLVVRLLDANGEVRESRVGLPGLIHGTPALGGDALVLPFADGTLGRASLEGDVAQAENGPNWRPLGASPDSVGHVLPWAGDDYLVSDGNRRLMLLHWPAGQKFNIDTKQALELPTRIAAVPLRLPAGEPSAVVVDRGNAMLLVRGATPKLARSWLLPGAVTAGPWALGGKVVCVVGRTLLVCVDPEKDGIAWTWTTTGDGIEFAPTAFEGSFVVADSAGLFVALDPATGAARAAGFRHPAEVGPASAVAPFGAGRLFAPLTDGSALLLPVPR